MSRILIEVTPEQAQATCKALEAYCRLGLGQLRAVGDMVREGQIRTSAGGMAPIELCDEIAQKLKEIEQLLGFSPGSSRGIGNLDNSQDCVRSYELMKSVEKVLANLRDPSPSFRGVNYDGLTVRYTKDPAPLVTLKEAESLNPSPGNALF